MRNEQQILDRISTNKSRDFFGFSTFDLVEVLPFAQARDFLTEEFVTKVLAGEEKWEPKSKDDAALKARITDYLPFAWDKANNCRGLSAGRSLQHFLAWFWLLGDDAFADELAGEYNLYGKRLLVKVSERVGFDWRKVDNNEWTNDEGSSGMTADEALAAAA